MAKVFGMEWVFTLFAKGKSSWEVFCGSLTWDGTKILEDFQFQVSTDLMFPMDPNWLKGVNDSIL